MTATGSPELLRHMVATLAYCGGKVVRDVPAGFGSVSAGGGTRSAVEILSHMGDLLDWALHLADGRHVWAEDNGSDWARQRDRFFSGLSRLDQRLAAGPTPETAEGLIQGPLADAFTHVGQLALLRRLAGAPVRGENYFKADIRAGEVGVEQAPPRYEFD